MSEENVEVVRRLTEARARDSRLPDMEIDWLRRASDSEVYRELMAPDVEIDMSRRVFNPEVYRGLEGLARLQKEIREIWQEWRMTPERFLDVGDRVVLIEHVHGRARGSGVELDIPSASIWTLRDGRVTHVEGGLDPDEALKAVGLEEQPMSANLDLVRSVYADWERGDFSRTDWADPAIELIVMGSMNDGRARGLAEMSRLVREVFSEMEHWRDEADKYRELRDGRVLVLDRLSGRGRASGVDLAEVAKRSARLFELRNGKVTRLVVYWDRDRAFTDLGLTPEGDEE